MNWILPKILAEITQAPRYLPTIEWSSKSWTHNVFRVWELIFWRRYGIKAEIFTLLIDGRAVPHAFSFEAVCVLVEQSVRQHLRLPKMRIMKFKVPQFAFADVGGFSVPQSPAYRYAIVFDAAPVSGATGAAATATFSHTCTGTDGLLFAFGEINDQTKTVTATYAAVSMTKTSNSPFDAFTGERHYTFFLAGPATGANDIVYTASSGTPSWGFFAGSYSGCSQTGIPDATTTNSSASTTGLTTSLASNADNCWHMLSVRSNTDLIAAGTGATKRTAGVDISQGIFDSNSAKTPAGSVSLTIDMLPGPGTLSIMMNSFAPPGVAGLTIVHPTLLTLAVG